MHEHVSPPALPFRIAYGIDEGLLEASLRLISIKRTALTYATIALTWPGRAAIVSNGVASRNFVERHAVLGGPSVARMRHRIKRSIPLPRPEHGDAPHDRGRFLRGAELCDAIKPAERDGCPSGLRDRS